MLCIALLFYHFCMFIQYNANPKNKLVGDCVIRAISKVTEKSWESIYVDLALLGTDIKDMPSSNEVWGTYLIENGFTHFVIPNFCPACYTIKQFCIDNQSGSFVIGTGTHAVAIINGNYYDTWDSGDEIPMYCFRKEY